MAKRRMAILALVLCLLSHTVFAASTTEAKEPIKTDAQCELTICYRYDETAFANQSVMLYRVAEVSADFQYTLTESFASSGLELNGIQTNGEWDVVRSTLEAHILAENIVPTLVAATDETGEAHFSQLKTGLYLASAVRAEQENAIYSFDSALIALPALGADGLWQYQLTAAAKSELTPQDKEIEYRVLKLWKGDENRNNRPRSIEVEIFCNGVSVETVILSEKNHWSYTWKAKDDGAIWKVVERNIPSGYTVTVEERTTTFVLTNTLDLDRPDVPKPPHTGDTSNVLLYIVLMHISGIALILLGLTRKRKRT